MEEYGSIYIEQISGKGEGGGQYFKDTKRDTATDILQEIYNLAEEFVIANDCSVELIRFDSSVKDKSFGFYIINRQKNGLVKVFYKPEKIVEKCFNQVFEKLLTDFFEIKNPVGLLIKQ